MAKPLHPALGRLKSVRAVFHGKFPPGEREGLAGMTQAHGGLVVPYLDAAVTHLVLPNVASGPAVQKKASALRKKGATIEVTDAAGFRELVRPTADELTAILKHGRRAAKALAAVTPRWTVYNHHGAAPECPRLVRANLDGVDLSGLDLSGVAFEKCRFVGAKLDGTCFAEAIECDFNNATGDSPRFGKIDCSRFANAQFRNAEFVSHLHGSDFTAANLDNCLFSEHFWGSRVTNPPSDRGPCFTRACLRGSVFDSVWIDGADLSRADLTKAAFKDAHLDRANFQKASAHELLLVAAHLRKADFSYASLEGANLAEADLTGSKLDGADFTGANLRGAKIDAGARRGIKGVSIDSTATMAAGPALIELDSVLKKAKQVKIAFCVGKHPGNDHELQITAYSTFSSLYLPDLNNKVSPWPLGTVPFSEKIRQAGRVFGHLPVRFETLVVKSTQAPTSGKALRDLVARGIVEAFGQPVPDGLDAAGAAAHRDRQRQAIAAERERRKQAEAAATKEKEKAKKLFKRTIEKAVGKVTDVASFVKALEFRTEKAKLEKATKMLKASGFELFNDVTDRDVTGVVKSQTDRDLVYACRLAHDGQYSCCTQNLAACGGLRGSLCKHLLVLVIGLVQAGRLDPSTVDGWVARTHGIKPELNKETMGTIFLKYKGAEAGEVDWRPTETIPEDFYAL
jgi:uncharacterized protein YjbI with pentapeptide repeats